MARAVDTVIIGAGSAGLNAMREVMRRTQDFLLVNDGHWGTTCAAVGCMPSKTLIASANAYHARGKMADLGIQGAEALEVDIPAVMARVRRLRDQFVKGPSATPGKLGDKAVAGRAVILGPNRVAVNGEEIAVKSIVIATGSTPVVPGPWRAFGERVVTTDRLFELPDLPQRIAVVGMGVIGVELAQALARLGCDVTGFDALETVAGITDPEVLPRFRELLERDLPLHLGAPAELAEGAGGAIRVTGAGGASVEADLVLAAMGRRPNIDGLGLESLGVALNDRGMPDFDPATMQIGDLPVFIAGDANADRPILHEASDEGRIAGRNAGRIVAGEGVAPYCRRPGLGIVFSSPQVAKVGLGFADLPEGAVIGAEDFANQSRAKTSGDNVGLMRVYADGQTGRFLGAEFAIPAAEHLAHWLALALDRRMSVGDMLRAPFYHPVLEEGMRGALRDAYRQLPQDDHSTMEMCPLG